MSKSAITQAIETEFYQLCDKLGHTAALHMDAQHVMPDGVPNRLQAHRPWPIGIDAGRGSMLIDVDGNHYRDFHNAFGTSICGHAHPIISATIREALYAPILTGFLHPDTVELGRILADRFGTEQYVMTNDGTGATQLAIRIARAHTQREPIIKVEGGYHGTHDSVMVSTAAAGIASAGDADMPNSVAWGSAVPESVRELTRVVSFNDLDAAERLLKTREYACLIIEPVMLNVGFVEPDEGYLAALRVLCDRYDTVLIADEVKTGATISYGGAHQLYGMQPDLLCLGKGIAGGLPVGIVAGKQELFKEISQHRAPHYSTFAANPLVVQCAVATLSKVLTPSLYSKLEDLNAQLIQGIERLLDEYGIAGYGVYLGAKGNVIFSPMRLRNYRDYATRVDRKLGTLYWLCLMNDGILLSPGADEQWTLSAAMDEEDVDAFLAAFERFCVIAQAALEADAKLINGDSR